MAVCLACPSPCCAHWMQSANTKVAVTPQMAISACATAFRVGCPMPLPPSPGCNGMGHETAVRECHGLTTTGSHAGIMGTGWPCCDSAASSWRPGCRCWFHSSVCALHLPTPCLLELPLQMAKYFFPSLVSLRTSAFSEKVSWWLSEALHAVL